MEKSDKAKIRDEHDFDDENQFRNDFLNALFEDTNVPIEDGLPLRTLPKANIVDILPSTSVAEFAELLLEFNTSALLVRSPCLEGLGIFTEADIRGFRNADWSMPILRWVSTQLVTATPACRLVELFRLFKVDGKRHVPLIINGEPKYLVRPRSLVRVALGFPCFEEELEAYDCRFFDLPARSVLTSEDNARRARLRLPLNVSLGKALSTMYELHGSAIRFPETGPVEAIFTERDLVKAAAKNMGPSTPIEDVANFTPSILVGDPTLSEVIENMMLWDIRHVFIDHPEGQFELVPRDIIRAIVDISPSIDSIMDMPPRTSTEIDGG